MDIDPSSASHADGGGDLWPFDSLTTSLYFSSISSSPPLHPLPVTSSSWLLAPPSPLWLFDDRQLMPVELAPSPAVAPESNAAAAPVAEDVHRARSAGKLSLYFRPNRYSIFVSRIVRFGTIPTA
jgi:hypothetical protein